MNLIDIISGRHISIASSDTNNLFIEYQLKHKSDLLYVSVVIIARITLKER